MKNKGRLQNLYKKRNFKPQIKPIIKNLLDELYQIENKQAKSAELGATIFWLVVEKKEGVGGGGGGRGSLKLQMQILGRNPQVHLIIMREWPKNNSLP